MALVRAYVLCGSYIFCVSACSSLAVQRSSEQTLVGLIALVKQIGNKSYCDVDFGFRPESHESVWQVGQNLRRKIVSYNNLLFGKDKLLGAPLSADNLKLWGTLLADVKDYVALHNRLPETSNLTKMMTACSGADYTMLYVLGNSLHNHNGGEFSVLLGQSKQALEQAMVAMCAEKYLVKADTKRVMRGVLYHLAVALLTTIEKIEREVKAY